MQFVLQTNLQAKFTFLEVIATMPQKEENLSNRLTLRLLNTCLWTEPMRTMKRVPLCFNEDLFLLSRQKRTESRLGFMIRKFTNVATRLSAFFLGSSVFAKFLLVTTSLILFIFLFLLWL